MDDQQWDKFIQWNQQELARFDRKLGTTPATVERRQSVTDRGERNKRTVIGMFARVYGLDKIEEWGVEAYPQGPDGYIRCCKDGVKYRVVPSHGYSNNPECFEWFEER